MSDYSDLKQRALSATAGPWYEQDDEDSAAGAVFIMPESDVWMPPICRITTEANAAYVASANPAAILELIDENESLRKDADKWQIVERAMTQLQSDEQGAAIWSACSRILISVANELNSARSVVTEEGVTNGGVEIGDWRVTVEQITAATGNGEQS